MHWRTCLSGIVLLSFALFEMVGCASEGDAGTKRSGTGEISIIYTNSTNGYMDPCKCPGKPLGGLARRATAIKKERAAQKNVLVVDSGDFFAALSAPDRNATLLETTKLINYDMVGVGDQELIEGVDHFQQVVARSGVPFVAANLRRLPDVPLAKPYLIKKYNGMKVAVTSIVSKAAFMFYPKEERKLLKIDDPIETLNKLIPKLRKKADLIVVLSHSGYGSDRSLVEKVSGMDVVVSGHSNTLLKKEMKFNDAIIVQAGRNGEHVGVLSLEIQEGKITSYQNRLIELDPSVPDDPEVREIIEQYKEARKSK